jgi:hypothetical protein
MHAIVRPEESSGERHEFPIAWVIKRLDPGNSLAKFRMHSSNVRGQLFLRIRRPGDQYRARPQDGLRHALQKRLIYRRVTAAAGVGLVMNVLVRMTAVHRCRIHLRRIEVKDPRLVMVDPDQSVIVLAHRLSLLVSRPACAAASGCVPAYSVLVPGTIATIIAMRITLPVLDLLSAVVRLVTPTRQYSYRGRLGAHSKQLVSAFR